MHVFAKIPSEIDEHCFRTSPDARAYPALFVIGFLSAADAHADSVRTFYILDAGIYKDEPTNNVVVAGTTELVNIARNIELLERTTNGPARCGARFELRYLIGGLPGTAVGITFIVHFPSTGLRNPLTGQQHFRSTHSKSTPVGIPLYREYQLEHDWEIVAGTWRFEFWHAGVKLGEQAFCLLLVSRSNQEGGSTVSGQECANDLVS